MSSSATFHLRGGWNHYSGVKTWSDRNNRDIDRGGRLSRSAPIHLLGEGAITADFSGRTISYVTLLVETFRGTLWYKTQKIS